MQVPRGAWSARIALALTLAASHFFLASVPDVSAKEVCVAAEIAILGEGCEANQNLKDYMAKVLPLFFDKLKIRLGKASAFSFSWADNYYAGAGIALNSYVPGTPLTPNIDQFLSLFNSEAKKLRKCEVDSNPRPTSPPSMLLAAAYAAQAYAGFRDKTEMGLVFPRFLVVFFKNPFQRGSEALPDMSKYQAQFPVSPLVDVRSVGNLLRELEVHTLFVMLPSAPSYVPRAEDVIRDLELEASESRLEIIDENKPADALANELSARIASLCCTDAGSDPGGDGAEKNASLRKELEEKLRLENQKWKDDQKAELQKTLEEDRKRMEMENNEKMKNLENHLQHNREMELKLEKERLGQEAEERKRQQEEAQRKADQEMREERERLQREIEAEKVSLAAKLEAEKALAAQNLQDKLNEVRIETEKEIADAKQRLRAEMETSLKDEVARLDADAAKDKAHLAELSQTERQGLEADIEKRLEERKRQLEREYQEKLAADERRLQLESDEKVLAEGGRLKAQSEELLAQDKRRLEQEAEERKRQYEEAHRKAEQDMREERERLRREIEEEKVRLAAELEVDRTNLKALAAQTLQDNLNELQIRKEKEIADETQRLRAEMETSLKDEVARLNKEAAKEKARLAELSQSERQGLEADIANRFEDKKRQLEQEHQDKLAEDERRLQLESDERVLAEGERLKAESEHLLALDKLRLEDAYDRRFQQEMDRIQQEFEEQREAQKEKKNEDLMDAGSISHSGEERAGDTAAEAERGTAPRIKKGGLRKEVAIAGAVLASVVVALAALLPWRYLRWITHEGGTPLGMEDAELFGENSAESESIADLVTAARRRSRPENLHHLVQRLEREDNEERQELHDLDVEIQALDRLDAQSVAAAEAVEFEQPENEDGHLDTTPKDPAFDEYGPSLSGQGNGMDMDESQPESSQSLERPLSSDGVSLEKVHEDAT